MSDYIEYTGRDRVVVTIVMPAWNAEKTITESVKSVIAQTYTDWELIVIDDCSDVPIEFYHPQIRVVRNDINRGTAYSRNRGIELANGKWLAFLDSDDVWRSDKLEKQLAFMVKYDAVISYTASSFFGSDYILPAVKKLTYCELLQRNLMSCSSVMVERRMMLKHMFTLRKNVHEDYVAYLQIVKEAGVAYGLNEPLLKYRLGGGSKSASRIKAGIMNYNAYCEVGYSKMIAAALTIRYAFWSIAKRRAIYKGAKGMGYK